MKGYESFIFLHSMFFLSLLVFGLIFGSFANALVWRLKTDQTLMGRSMCPECRATIHWYDNIPVLSFVWLFGRCRACHRAISWRYPIVELLMAFGFVGMGWSTVALPIGTDFAVTLSFWCALWFVLLTIAVFDWLYYEIPMVLLWIGLGVAVIFESWRESQLWLGGLWSLSDSRLIGGGIAGLGAFLIFTALSRGAREHWMGWGDAWLVLLLGLVAGWPGILWVITIGSGVGSVFGIALLAVHRGGLKTRVPFAPLLILGFWAIVAVQLFGYTEVTFLLGMNTLL
jgi:leader peptidase (prepilin peptidase)/N-methyltransferase